VEISERENGDLLSGVDLETPPRKAHPMRHSSIPRPAQTARAVA
jgi:hypothetical protein